MNDFNLKKLVTGFLTLAFLASSLSLIFSSHTPTDITSLENKDIAQQVIPSNALTETLPVINETTGERSAFIATANNLTQNLSATLADQIIAANPSGPLDFNGTLGANAPTEESLILAVNQMINDPQVIAQVISSLPGKEKLPAPKNVIRTPTASDVANYINSLDAIFGPEMSLLKAPSNSVASLEAVSALDTKMSEWLLGLQKLSVPEPLVPLHMAIFNLFHTTSYFSQTALDASGDDPLKQLVLIQAGSARIDEAIEQYNYETMRVEGILKQFAFSPSEIQNSNAHVIANLFAIQKAYAIDWGALLKTVVKALKKALVFVGGAFGCVAVHTAATADETVSGAVSAVVGGLTAVPVSNGSIEGSTRSSAVNSAATESYQFKDCLLKILTDIVKDRLVHKLVQQTIQWVQGGFKGKPQFVTDWKGFLADAGNKAAGDAINRIAPGLCRSWAPLIRVQLESAFLGDTPVTCTLDQVVANAKAFYNDFSQGGWTGYGAAILPSGNYFGQLFEGSQVVAAQEFADREAAKSQAESGKGFLSTALCVSYDMLSPFDTCVDRAIESCSAQQSKTIDCAAAARASCAGISTKEEKVCRPGGNLITTPGSAVGEVVNNALGAPIHRIVSAQDITALISAFINSGLDALTKVVKKDKDENDGKPNPTGLLGIRIASSTQAGLDQCIALKGDALLKCLQASMIGTVSVPGISLPGSCPEFSAAVCHASSCAGRNDGNLSYDLRMGNVNWDTVNNLLFSGDTAPGGDLSRGNWYTVPEDDAGWCDPNASQFKTGIPGNAPKFDMSRRCADKSNGGIDFSAYPTCGQGEEGGGGESGCTDTVHCTCNSQANPNAAILKYSGAVAAAQDEVAKNPSANGLDPANPSHILDYNAYHKAVVCSLRSQGYLADHDGEEVNVSRAGDTFQENMDISSSPTNGSLTILIDNAVCSSKNGDGAYPSFTNAPKVACP